MRATSSVMCYCIPHAIPELLKTNDFHARNRAQDGRNSMLVKKFPMYWLHKPLAFSP